jgi:DNA repair exonuclease SbcCD ATPase subunit
MLQKTAIIIIVLMLPIITVGEVSPAVEQDLQDLALREIESSVRSVLNNSSYQFYEGLSDSEQKEYDKLEKKYDKAVDKTEILEDKVETLEEKIENKNEKISELMNKQKELTKSQKEKLQNHQRILEKSKTKLASVKQDITEIQKTINTIKKNPFARFIVQGEMIDKLKRALVSNWDTISYMDKEQARDRSYKLGEQFSEQWNNLQLAKEGSPEHQKIVSDLSQTLQNAIISSYKTTSNTKILELKGKIEKFDNKIVGTASSIITGAGWYFGHITEAIMASSLLGGAVQMTKKKMNTVLKRSRRSNVSFRQPCVI